MSTNGKGLERLQGLVPPVRERLEASAKDLARALGRAGESMKQIRISDVAVIVRRSPVGALALAAGIGFLVGLSLWARGE